MLHKRMKSTMPSSIQSIICGLTFLVFAGCSESDTNLQSLETTNQNIEMSLSVDPFDTLFSNMTWRVKEFRSDNQILVISEAVRPTIFSFIEESATVNIDIDCSERSGFYEIVDEGIFINTNFTRLNTCSVSSEIHNLEIQVIEDIMSSRMSVAQNDENIVLTNADGKQLILAPFENNSLDCCPVTLLSSGGFLVSEMSPAAVEEPISQLVINDEELLTSATTPFEMAFDKERVISEIDFSQHTIIVITAELQNVSSYFIEILEYNETATEIQAIVQTVINDCETSVATSGAAFKIYRVPRIEKPIIFETTTLITDDFCF